MKIKINKEIKKECSKKRLLDNGFYTNVFIIPYYNSLTQLKTKFCLKCQ